MCATLRTILFLCPLFLLSSCVWEYAGKVKYDGKRNFIEKKEIIFSLGFQGQVIDKLYCDSCVINKYSVLIRLIEYNFKPDFGHQQYPPYYSFKGDSLLLITVSNEIFENSIKGKSVVKAAESNYMELNGKSFLFLNKEKLQWVPKD